MIPQAVIFDLGGVVLDSPMEAIADFEQRHGIRPGTVNRVVVDTGGTGAWARHERGEMHRGEFLRAFADEFAAVGLRVDTEELLADIDRSIRVRPSILQAVDDLRDRGLKVAALTNNWTPFGAEGLARHFDVMVESVVEGTRKPEDRIYRICLARLAVAPTACVMLDDLGLNLKPARALGMTTVKVTSEEHALGLLSRLIDGLKSGAVPADIESPAPFQPGGGLRATQGDAV